MASRVGSDLRRARTRREIELSEVEEATRIRVRFLEAIESEEWEALPGGVYTRGFIRAYGSYLGMDGDRLARDYREQVEGVREGTGPSRELAPVAAAQATGSPGGGRSSFHPGLLAVPAVLAVAVITIVAWPAGDEDGGSAERASPARPAVSPGAAVLKPEPQTAQSAGIELSLTAGGEVWVCLLDDKDRPLVEGVVLEAGAHEGPFRSGSFTVSFGNGEVSMTIDGRQADIPTTASPIGYSVGPEGELTELAEAERPTCV